MGNSSLISVPTPAQRLSMLDATVRKFRMDERALDRKLIKLRETMENVDDPKKKALLQIRYDVMEKGYSRASLACTQYIELHQMLKEIHLQGEMAHNTNRFLMGTQLDLSRVDAVRGSLRSEIDRSGPDFLKVALDKLERLQGNVMAVMRGDENVELGELESLYRELSLPSVPGKEASTVQLDELSAPLEVKDGEPKVD